MSTLSDVYQYHHKKHGRSEFSILEKERGELFKKWIGTGKKVLDIGCRDGTLTQYFIKGNTVTGYDIDQEMLAKAQKKGIQAQLADLNAEWQTTEKFDVVVAAEVIEHLYYPDIVCKKIANTLKPDGMFIGSVPNAYNIKNRLRYLFAIQKHTPLEDRTHINHFSYKILHETLSKHFKHVEIKGLAGGIAQNIANITPNLGSFVLTWKCSKPRT